MTSIIAAQESDCDSTGSAEDRCVYFRIGFRVTRWSVYNKWTEDQRQDAKAEIRAEITNVCSQLRLDGWNGFGIDYNQLTAKEFERWKRQGHLPEIWNQDLSQECLNEIPGPIKYRLFDPGKDQKSFSMPTSEVIYVYVNERQICVHDYSLVKQTSENSNRYKQWAIKAGPTGKKVNFLMYGSFQWPTYLPV